MVEGVYLASFALSALSWGLSLFLMAYEWNPRIYLIFLWCSHSPLAQITMSHHFLFLLHLPSGSAQAVCLMSACSTILSKQWISRLLKITPRTVWVTNYPHRRIPLPLSFFYYLAFTPCLTFSQSWCSRTAQDLFPARIPAPLCVRSCLPNHLYPWHLGQIRKWTVSTLHQLQFLSLQVAK